MPSPRILVAEDEMIVAMDLCDTVKEAGYLIEGPHPDLSAAMLAVQKRKPDVAILDIGLHDGDSFRLAEHLTEENIPVIFHSGRYSRDEMKQRFPDAMTCVKPCPPNEILRKVEKALSN